MRSRIVNWSGDAERDWLVRPLILRHNGGDLKWGGGRWWWSLLSPLATAVPLWSQAVVPLRAPPQATTQAPLVFRGVTVIDVRDGRRLPAQTVVIAGNRIQRMGAAGTVELPKGAQVVAAKGKYLIPGLWDMHVHIHDYIDLDAPLLLANGVTGVRDAGSRMPLAVLNQWKHEIAAGTRAGPRLVVSGPRTFEAQDGATTIQARGDELIIPRAALTQAIDSLKAAGADLFKTYLYSREGYFAAVKTARRAGLLVGGHVPHDRNEGRRGLVAGLEASDSGVTFLDHGVNPCIVFDDPHPDWAKLPRDAKVGRHLDAEQCAAAVRRFRKNNSWSVLTPVLIGLPDSLTGQPPKAVSERLQARSRRYRPDSIGGGRAGRRASPSSTTRAGGGFQVREPRSTADWAMRKRIAFVARLVADSVPILIATDMHPMYGRVTPGFSLHEAMEVLALHGASPLAVLQSATLNPAKALRATDSLGTVAAGKVADLVLLDADPLVDAWNTTKIQAVVANGRYYDRQLLDQLLKDAELAARKAPPFNRP